MKQEILDFRKDPRVTEKPTMFEPAPLDDKHSKLYQIWQSGRLQWRKASFCTNLCVDFNKGDGSGEDGVCVENCFNAYDSALDLYNKEFNSFNRSVEDIKARGEDVYEEYLV